MTSRRYTIVLASLLTLGTGCAITPPPSIQPGMPRRAITPRSYRTKLAVFNLLDPTGSGGRLTEKAAEALAVALFERDRFEVMQRAEVAGVDPANTKEIKEDYGQRLDALVVGSITHFNTADKTMRLNVNVMNPQFTTMAAKTFEVRYTGTINVDVERDGIDRIAEWLERAFPKLSDGTVMARSGENVSLNLGSEDGVQVGMGLLISSHGDIVRDPATGDFLGSDIYVGEAYVVAVDAKKSEARLEPRKLGGAVPEVIVGDKVEFK